MNLEIPPLPPASATPITIDRWPTEIPLRIAVVIVSLMLWLTLALSIFGIVYAGLIGLVLFFSHVAFITHVRGSAVRLGPEQFPELWARVGALSRRAGLAEPPESYLMEAGGSLNAFATKFFGGRLVVLYSDLLEACNGDDAARDMIIGHELGHLRSGHLDWWWLTAPGRLLPFLGSAYSRACEYSCDRWGAALCGEPGGAARGLAILAAGPGYAHRINLDAFVAQQQHLDGGWMTLGSWLSGYPPLSARVAAVEPTLAGIYQPSHRGPLRALGLLGAVVGGPFLVMVGGLVLWTTLVVPKLLQATNADAPPSDLSALIEAMERAEKPVVEDVEAAKAQVARDLAAIAEVLRSHHAATGEMVEDGERITAIWASYRGDAYPAADPFDGLSYGISVDAAGLALFSSGPDGEPGTGDDIELEVGW